MKVVAICGSGRSGSTLLSLLLTQHPAVFNLGQTRDLWAAHAAAAPCSCGSPLPDCPVHGPVLHDVTAGPGRPDAAALAQAARRFLAQAARLPDWSDAAATQALAGRHAPLLAALAQTLEGLAAATGAEAMVDASKSPEWALLLGMVPGVELRVLNLLRDPGAVAVSWQRRQGSLRAAWRFARAWGARQDRIDRWAVALGPRLHALRYEDLVQAPEPRLAEAAAACGLPLAGGLFAAAGVARIDWSRQHLYPPANEAVLAERPAQTHICPRPGWQAPAARLGRLAGALGAGASGRRHYPHPG